ncbi:hypothetical protein GR927_46545 [Mycolicibacterium sp. 3033]|nr:hypothetical protein [Mycolicibacterium aurantiacum]
MTEYSGTVADLARDIGQALDAIHDVLWGMRNVIPVAGAINRCEPQLQLIEDISRRLQGETDSP